MGAASLFSGLIGTVLLLGVVVGIWVGLAGLWRTRRGAAWWLMAVGTALNTIGPIAFVAGSILMANAVSRSVAVGGGPAASLSSGLNIPIGASVLTTAGVLAIPVGLLLFGIGFAIHGMKAARTQERMGELEQLTQAMDEEISRLKQEPSRS
jgi:hypothetical protein